jgi:hypothetical protein
MLYFAALVIFNGPSGVSKTLIGIFAACLFIALAPWLMRRGGDPERELRRVLTTYRPRRTERIELIVALTLWSFIGLALVFLFHVKSK